MLLLCVVLCEIVVERSRHVREVGCGGLQIQAQAYVAYAVGGDVAKACNLLVALYVVGNILPQRVETVGAEEDEHVVGHNLLGGNLGAHGAVHLGL